MMNELDDINDTNVGSYFDSEILTPFLFSEIYFLAKNEVEISFDLKKLKQQDKGHNKYKYFEVEATFLNDYPKISIKKGFKVMFQFPKMCMFPKIKRLLKSSYSALQITDKKSVILELKIKRFKNNSVNLEINKVIADSIPIQKTSI